LVIVRAAGSSCLCGGLSYFATGQVEGRARRADGTETLADRQARGADSQTNRQAVRGRPGAGGDSAGTQTGRARGRRRQKGENGPVGLEAPLLGALCKLLPVLVTFLYPAL
jgi:hypothetical protein